MKNKTQIERYKKLLSYLEEQFKEDINIEKVEGISHYSYRNINRIFQALNHETIGKYIKRLRLEKAAQYLKFSGDSVSDIAFEVGFEDVAAFSKAFKNHFGFTPSSFRQSSESLQALLQQTLFPDAATALPLPFEIEYLPAFDFLCLEYRGAYEDIDAINKLWESFLEYTTQKNLVTEDSIFMAEILDDDDISEQINCRYNLALILEQPLPFQPEGLFRVKHHARQKYAKFIHQGPHELSVHTYHEIYARWMQEVHLEFADLPNLEFFPNDEADTPPEELITEIYIPVI